MNDLRQAAEMALAWIEAQPEPRMIGAQACIEALRKALTEDSTVERELRERNSAVKDGVLDRKEQSNKTEDVPCKTHPDAPHGFLRNASHSEGRYICECEYWEPEEEKNS